MVAAEAVTWLLWPLALVLAMGVSMGTILWVSRGTGSEIGRLRARFIHGVPWGSLVVVAAVFGIYLVVQGGATQWDRPLYYPFINWSYLYPTGVILGPFTHAGPGHLLSNLTATAVLAPLAEYIWGHGVTAVDDDDPPRWGRPVIRAFVLFPAAVLVVGLLTSVFAWGPVIGFSGVVFAFAGFTVIRYPLGTVIALAARRVIREVMDALLDPVVVAEVSTELARPWWVGISFQGHAFGFLLGALIGILLLHHRGAPRPDARRLWFGATLVMVGLGLWAIWAALGDDTFALYRGLGLVLLFGVVLVLTAATVASTRSLWGRLTRRQGAVLVFAIPVLLLALLAIPFNVLTVVDHESPEPRVTVGEYEVYYAEDVERRLRPVVGMPGFGGSEASTASGVIVVNEDRHMWFEAVSTTELAFDGEADIVLGGLGSRTDVSITREGWVPTGNESVFRVEIDVADGPNAAFPAASRQVDATVGGHAFAIEANESGFFVTVTDPDGETRRQPVPAANESITVHDVTIRHAGDQLIAELDGTSVPIAERERADSSATPAA